MAFSHGCETVIYSDPLCTKALDYNNVSPNGLSIYHNKLNNYVTMNAKCLLHGLQFVQNQCYYSTSQRAF